MKPTPETMIDLVCRHTGINREQLQAREKGEQVDLARQILMYLMRYDALPPLPYPKIGILLGGRGDQAVRHGIEKIETALAHGNAYVKETIRLVRSYYKEEDKP